MTQQQWLIQERWTPVEITADDHVCDLLMNMMVTFHYHSTGHANNKWQLLTKKHHAAMHGCFPVDFALSLYYLDAFFC